MSNLIDFSQLGGYRLEQPTFEKMQATYYLFLKAMIGHFGIPDTGNYIISGCTISGANITAGILYIDGVLCPFAEAPGTIASKIKKQVTTQTLAFQNGTTPVVFQNFTAVVDAAGTALSEFVRVPSPFNLPANLVIDANYVHTDNNFTATLLTKLLGIEANAQVNVKPDWNQLNQAAANAILNRPQGNFLMYLHKGERIHGDLIGLWQSITINFPNLGTDQYQVLGNIVVSGTNPGSEVRLNFVTRDHTASSFKVQITDTESGSGQNLTFQYIIVPI